MRRAAYLVGLVWLPILVIWSGIPFALTFDDSYYYAEIARNLVDGNGSTFDTINSTNGYHPLWLGLSLPVFLLGFDGTGAIRALLVVQLALWVTTLWVLAGIAGRRLGGTPKVVVLVSGAVLALTGGNPFVVKMVVNGLESAPAALIAVLLLDRVDRNRGEVLGGTQLTRLLTGCLLGLAFLARTDAIGLLACVAAWCVVEGRRATAPSVSKAMAEVLVLPSLTVFAYGAINLAWFGHLSPVSGDVDPNTQGSPARVLAVIVVGSLAVALMAWLSRDRNPDHPPKFWRVAGFTAHTAWYPAYLVLLAGYYLVLSPQVWLWYFAPIGLYATATLVLVAADLSDGARLESPDTSARRSVAPIAAILAVPLILALGVQARTLADSNLRSIQEANRQAGLWISDNLPADAVLGSWDAGVVGYFTDQPVMHLDGVFNSFEYRKAREQGTEADFLRDRGLAYLVNHGDLVEGEDPDIADVTAELLDQQTADGLDQVHRDEFRYAGSTTGSSGPGGGGQMAVFVYQLDG